LSDTDVVLGRASGFEEQFEAIQCQHALAVVQKPERIILL
jgi:hypothetical protein